MKNKYQFDFMKEKIRSELRTRAFNDTVQYLFSSLSDVIVPFDNLITRGNF